MVVRSVGSNLGKSLSRNNFCNAAKPLLWLYTRPIHFTSIAILFIHSPIECALGIRTYSGTQSSGNGNRDGFGIKRTLWGFFFVSSTKNSTEIGIIFVWNIMDQAFTAFLSLSLCVFKFPFFVHSPAQKENNSNSCYSFNQKPQRKIHTPIYSHEITNFPANEWISKCNAIPR